MSRNPRLQIEGGLYHVFNRGARRQATFLDDRDRSSFVRLLATIHEKFEIEIHAWCLMGNHYHLLLRTPRGNIAQGMQYLLGRYTQEFNLRHGFDGALFRGRYQGILVDTDRYLVAVSRYIHRNPLEAGMVERLEAYPWSSFNSYAGDAATPAWLHTDLTLSQFGHDRPRWRSSVTDGDADYLLECFYAQRPIPAVLGDEAFRRKAEQSRTEPPAAA